MTKQSHLYDVIALSVGCRYCYAKPGENCINKITNQPTRFPHQYRITDSLTKALNLEDDEVIF